jgi:inner membrane transporter RhtA
MLVDLGPRVRAHLSVPAHAYFLVSAVFHYLGPAFAVLLFAAVDPLGVVWLRIVSAAAVFALWRRPWRVVRRLDGRARGQLLTWGGVLGVMNASFYLALDRLPLGTVAALEFVPVVVLAALGVRTWQNLLALTLVVPGVALLTGVHLAGEPLGLVLAAVNAVLFAAYVMLAHRVSRHPAVSGIDGLALAMLVAAVVTLPLGLAEAAPAFAHLDLLAAGVGVGVCSSVVPYVCDQLAMARLSRATYALLVSLLPATATVIGVLVLAQLPGVPALLGVALVVAGVAVHRDPQDAHRADRSPRATETAQATLAESPTASGSATGRVSPWSADRGVTPVRAETADG